jgi:tetratricopeptide (TPR) repeat protein
VWRWGRRNAGLAGLTTAVALLVLVWAVTSSGLAWGLKLEKDEADQQTILAVANGMEAGRQTIIAKDNEKRALDTADGAVQQLVFMGQTLHNRLQGKSLSIQAAPEVQKLREDLLGLVRESLKAVSGTIEKTGTSNLSEVATNQAMGDLAMGLGQDQEAVRAFQRGYELIERIAAANPDNDKIRANLGIMVQRQGTVALDLNGDARTARARYTEARDIHQEVLTKPRGGEMAGMPINVALSHDDYHLGRTLLALGRPTEARPHFEESLTYRQAWAAADPKNPIPRNYVMQARLWLGMTASHLNDAKGVQEHFAEAVRLGEELDREHPEAVSFRADLAETHGAYGDALLRLGKLEDAEKSYQDALKNVQGVVAKKPDDLSQQPLLAETYERLGALAARQVRGVEAETHYATALRLRTELLKVDQTSLPRQTAYLLALARCGKHVESARGVEQIRLRASKSTPFLLQIARCLAVCAAANSPQRQDYAEKAVQALQAATKDDYQDATILDTDLDLASLRGEPAFQMLIAQVKGRRR